MQPKEIFILAIRLLGIVFLYHGLSAPASALLALLSGEILGVLIAFSKIAWPLILAHWLIRGAPLIVRIAYPEPKPVTQKDPDWKEVCIQDKS